uniref:Uncharacterized protein n=1 Tax=Tetranychus urticae TaxID=32264 RepID=T1L4M6_TETUR
MILKMCTKVGVYQEAYRKDGFKGLMKAIVTSIPEIIIELLGDPRAVIAFVGRLLTRKEITEMFSKHSGLALLIGSFAARLA